MANNSFLGITYESWQETCEMFLSPVNNFRLRQSFSMYIQDYPFTKLTLKDKQEIESLNFYTKYIESGSILFNDSVLFRTKNFVIKNSGGFRNSQLLSPFMFLIQQAIGLEVQKRYQEIREVDDNLIAFYSGNFLTHNVLYKNEYQDFSKWNNYYAVEDYPYFIKTDLSDYFTNINLNELVASMNKRCNKKFTPLQQKTIVDIFSYCGNGKYPLVQNSVSSSFLATRVYLDDIDVNLGKFINNLPNIQDYKLIRYVDDLYIWLKPKSNDVNQDYNDIRSEYSSLLRKKGLTLNTSKTGLYKSQEINEQLKKTIYNDVIAGQSNAVDEDMRETDWTDNIKEFISRLSDAVMSNKLNKETFENIVSDCFKPDKMIEFTGEEVLKYIIYDNNKYLQDDEIIINLDMLVANSGISFIYLSPKLLISMIVNATNGQNKNRVIKAVLKQLFNRNREGLINSYDVMIVIQYLLLTHFHHPDLKEKIIKSNESELYYYIMHYCCNNFFDDFKRQNNEKYVSIINGDWKTYYLYFNFKAELDNKSYMEAYAYFKTYFDRMTALIAAYIEHADLNIKKYYQKTNLVAVYKNLQQNDAEKIIKKANKLRNRNPLVHSSSEMLGMPDWTENIKNMIKKLTDLIKEGINNIE